MCKASRFHWDAALNAAGAFALQTCHHASFSHAGVVKRVGILLLVLTALGFILFFVGFKCAEDMQYML